MCYTYDAQSRVTKRTVINLANNTSKDEVFAYDEAGKSAALDLTLGQL